MSSSTTKPISDSLFDGVIFDCDSTLSTIEGIDELAALVNVKTTVEKLTNQTMNGQIPLEAVYTKRLALIRPNREHLAQVAQQYLHTITLGAKDTIYTLQQQGIKVAIVSGGGDGTSDIAALGAADVVIGYGGIVCRKQVKQPATFFYEQRDLRGLLKLILSS